MSALNQIAYSQNRRDDAPNKELALHLADTRDSVGIREIADNLWNKDSHIQSDCIKVLYEIGYIHPELIAPYANSFVKLLRSRNNRLVWGGMIALSTIAMLAADVIDTQRIEIQKAIEKGSVITIDAGTLVMAHLAASSAERRRAIFPYLLEQLMVCRPKDLPQRAEKIVIAVNHENCQDFIRAVEQRIDLMTAGQLTRLRRVLRQAQETEQE